MSPYVVPDSRLASVQLERNTDNLPKTLTPTFWAELTIVPFDSLVDPAQSDATPNDDDDDVSAELSSQGSMDTGTTLSKLVGPQPPPVPHKHFFFDDGNITFLVEGILYRVHRYFFCRDSNDFKDRLSRLSTQLEPTPDSPPVIQLDDVKAVDFDDFLSVLYPQNFNTIEERSFEEWSSILDLSTRWGFTSIRDLAIRCLEPPSPLRRLVLARKHAVEEWVNPALLELCERPEPLSLDEARHMVFEDVVLVGSVRENVRSTILTTDGTGIGDCIQAWRSGEPWSRPLTPGIPVGFPFFPTPGPVGSPTPGIPVGSRTPGIPVGSRTPGIPVGSRTSGIPFGSPTPGIPVESRTPGIPVGSRTPGIPSRTPGIPLGSRTPGIPVGSRTPGIPLGSPTPGIPVGSPAPPAPASGASGPSTPGTPNPPPPSSGFMGWGTATDEGLFVSNESFVSEATPSLPKKVKKKKGGGMMSLGVSEDSRSVPLP